MLLDDQLSAIGWVGVALALPAVALASWTGSSGGFRLADLAYGTVAGCGFGLLFVALDQAGDDAGAWPLVPGQAVALVLVVAAALPALSKLRGSGDRLQIGVVARWGAAAGILGAGANLMFLLASAGGQLAIVAVLAGLYPAVTAMLAPVVLGERPRALQVVGLVAAAMSVVLIVAC